MLHSLVCRCGAKLKLVDLVKSLLDGIEGKRRHAFKVLQLAEHGVEANHGVLSCEGLETCLAGDGDAGKVASLAYHLPLHGDGERKCRSKSFPHHLVLGIHQVLLVITLAVAKGVVGEFGVHPSCYPSSGEKLGLGKPSLSVARIHLLAISRVCVSCRSELSYL